MGCLLRRVRLAVDRPPISTGPDPVLEAGIADRLLSNVVALPDGLTRDEVHKACAAEAHRLLCQLELRPGATGTAAHAGKVYELLHRTRDFTWHEPKDWRKRLKAGESYDDILLECGPDPKRYRRALVCAAKEIRKLNLYVIDEPYREMALQVIDAALALGGEGVELVDRMQAIMDEGEVRWREHSRRANKEENT